jgi:hypothetical protein
MDTHNFMHIERTTFRNRVCFPVFELLCCFILSACASTPQDQTHFPLSNAHHLPNPDLTIDIPSLSNCTQSDDSSLHLNSHEPVTVIVHGCFSSAARFRSLANVFAFHGQQTICFNYNDRGRLSNSSAELITAIEKLSEHLHKPEITIIGHSQGGLVARRALIEERPDRLEADNTHIRLITISTPFGGIKSASHCGSKPMAWFSLGITKLICQLVTGSKYREIPPNSDFINVPGDLIPTVNGHLKIATDELESCRQYNDRGNCIEDDFVFSLDEQVQAGIDDDTNLSSVIVKSGHVEIVGNGKTEPTILIDILQQQGVLSPTLPERAEELSHLMKQLYLDERTE